MSLIKELQRLVQQDGPVSGRVISISGTNVIISTSSGQIETSANGDLSVGDLVTVDAGRAIKKQRDGDVPIYYV